MTPRFLLETSTEKLQQIRDECQAGIEEELERRKTADLPYDTKADYDVAQWWMRQRSQDIQQISAELQRRGA